MSELAPPAHPALRRQQRLDGVRRMEEQIARLQVQVRLELDALTREDLAGLGTRYVSDEVALVMHRSPRQARNRQEQAQLFAEFPAVHALVGDGSWLLDHADAAIEERVGSGLEGAQQQQVLELVLQRRRFRMTPYEVRLPGCPRKAMACDKDHLIPWPRGSTSATNLADECEHHHLGKHDCLSVERLPDGTFRWTTPCGITADRPPRPVLDAWTYRTLRP